MFTPHANGMLSADDSPDQRRRHPFLARIRHDPPQNGGVERIFIAGSSQRIVLGKWNDHVVGLYLRNVASMRRVRWAHQSDMVAIGVDDDGVA